MRVAHGDRMVARERRCEYIMARFWHALNNNKHAYAGVNDCFTHLRALLVLLNTAAFWPTQIALLGIIPPTEVTQRLWYFGSGSMTLALNTLLDLLATKAPPLKHRVLTSVLTGRKSELTSVLTGRTNS
jgi:hypothetical protein